MINETKALIVSAENAACQDSLAKNSVANAATVLTTEALVIFY
jgi:hypothetical protein